jgi:hypothetical protein
MLKVQRNLPDHCATEMVERLESRVIAPDHLGVLYCVLEACNMSAEQGQGQAPPFMMHRYFNSPSFALASSPK